MNADILRTTDVFLEGTRKPVLVILGPTAGGKTALSIALAHHINGEIVNADSRQMYKGLNIGTAKITEEEMQGIPHHLIDTHDPKEEVTVGWYQSEATRVIEDILSRGKIPLLVGGSMLYIASITDGLTLAPAVDPHLHQQLIDNYKNDRGEMLYKRLQKIDPDAAASIHQNNMPRVVRAVEIYEMLKAPKSKVMSARGELRPRTASATPRGHRSQFNLLIFGVERSSDDLKKRIAQRTDQMIDAGWVEEVRSLLNQGYTEDDPGMKSHGYRQIIHYLRELESGDGDPEFMKEELKKQIAAKTRQYARRQSTWWRGDERIRWVSV